MSTNVITQESIDTAIKYGTLLNGHDLFPFSLAEALDEKGKTVMLYIIGRTNNDMVSDTEAFIASAKIFGAKSIRITSCSMLINDTESSFSVSKNRFAGVSDPAMFVHSLDLETKEQDVIAIPYRDHSGAMEWMEPISNVDDITNRHDVLENSFESETYREITKFINEFVALSNADDAKEVMSPITTMSIILANESSKSRKSIMFYGPTPNDDLMGGFAIPDRLVHEPMDGFSFYHFSFGDILKASSVLHKSLFIPMMKR